MSDTNVPYENIKLFSEKLKESGYNARTNSETPNLIFSSVSGANFIIEFKDGDESISFVSSFEITTEREKILYFCNTFNTKWRFGKCILNEQNNILIFMDSLFSFSKMDSEYVFKNIMEKWSFLLGKLAISLENYLSQEE